MQAKPRTIESFATPRWTLLRWGYPGIKSPVSLAPNVVGRQLKITNLLVAISSILFPRGVVACTFLFIVLPVNRFVATPAAAAGQPVRASLFLL